MLVKTALIDQGLPGKLGAVNYALLTVLVAKADKEGMCRVAFTELARIMDVTPRSISRRVQELFNFEVEGWPILQRELGGLRIAPGILEGGQNCPIYKSEISVNNITNAKGFNASTVLSYFGNKYQEAYGTKYNFMYKRDLRLVKTKLIQVYGAENTIKIIDEAFRQRSLYENPPKYPYITIGGLVTFIANKVMTDIVQSEKQDSQDVAAFNQEMMEKYWDDYFGD